jgi:small subunit ribosomal protein S16e
MKLGFWWVNRRNMEPEILRFKAYEPILFLGQHRFADIDMHIHVKGEGHTYQIYAIR